MQLNTKPTKKMMLPLILEVLKEHSDSEHTLSQKDIREILENQYLMEADRKTVRRNIDCLIELGYPIEFTRTVRRKNNPETGEPEEEELITDLWLAKDFEDSELRLLIDAILFSSHIPEKQKNDLIDKLTNLSGKHFKSKMRHVKSLSSQQPQNPQLFLNIDLLDEAIRDGKKVCFARLEYDDCGNIQVKKVRDEVYEYEVNPCQMIAKNGHYYLICQRPGAGYFFNLRIDFMTGVRILDEPVEPYVDSKTKKIKPFHLEAYLKEHPLASENTSAPLLRDRIFRGVVPAVLKVRKEAIGDVIDYFGTSVVVNPKSGLYKEVKVKADVKDIIDFVSLHFPDVVILQPTKLAEVVANRALGILYDYGIKYDVFPTRLSAAPLGDTVKELLEKVFDEVRQAKKANRAKSKKKKTGTDDQLKAK